MKYDDPFRNARIAALESQSREDLDSIEALQEKTYCQRQKEIGESFQNKQKKLEQWLILQKHKIYCPRKWFERQVTSRFISGKMLMFANVSQRLFIYDMIDVFCFPNEVDKEICARSAPEPD